MRSAIFYFLLYLRPVISLVLTVITRATAFLTVGVLFITAIDGTWLRSVPLMAFLVAVSLLSFVAREKYVSLLLELQPSGTRYTFYQ